MTVYTKSMMESLAEVRDLQLEDNMDLMRKAAGGSAQNVKMKDGKLKMDAFTASAIMKVYDKVNPANKKKIETIINSGKKNQMMKLQSMAMKAIKSDYDAELDEAVKRGTLKDLENLEKSLRDAKKKKDKKKADALQKELEALMKSGLGKKIGPDWMHKEETELDEMKSKSYALAVKGKIVAVGSKADMMKMKKQKGGEIYMSPGAKVGDKAEEVELDERFKLVSARGKDIAKKMKKNRTMAPHAKEVAKMQTVTPDKLDRMLPDYVSGGDIRAMFKEELDEAKQVLAHGGKGKYKVVNDGSGNIDVMFKGKSVGKGDYDRGAGSFFMSIKGEKGQKSFKDVQAIADYFAKNKITEAHEMGTDEYRKYLEDLTPHSTESARSDAMRAMRRDKSMIRGKDSADVDDVATKDDRKAASKNILQQLKKTLDTKGKTDIEFLDKKKKKVPYDIAVKAVKKYMGFRSSTDKLKFQQALAKSYKSMLQAVKEDYVVPKTHSESILDRIDTKLRERKNG